MRSLLQEDMMRYGAMNFPIKPVLKEIKALAGMGFDYVELSLDCLLYTSPSPRDHG